MVSTLDHSGSVSRAGRPPEETPRDDADLVLRISRLLAAELDLDRLLQLLTDEATRLVGARFGALFYSSGDGDQPGTLYTLSGAPREALAGFPAMARDTPLFAPTFRGEPPIRIADVTTDPRYGGKLPHRGMPPGHLPVRSYLAAPVVSRSGQVLGGLFLGHPEAGVFTERAERLLVGVAAQGAVAIDNARLYERARRQEERVAELLAREQTARAAAEQANRAKDEFLAMLGHELRNPLAPIMTALQLMRLRGTRSREQEVLERQIGHLTRLVDDLLDISRITRGKIDLRLEPLELAEVVARALEITSPVLEQRRHRVQVDIPRRGLLVRVDPDRMVQVVANLLANAVKYSDAGSPIRLQAAATPEGMVRLSIRDQGIGIAAEMLERIFDMFAQQPQTLARSGGGLGLGLTIVRSLVELHGGRVRAESEGLGRGSLFVIELPAVSAAGMEVAEDTTERRRATSDEGRGRILVVDDNQDAAMLMGEALEALGYRVRIAYDGPLALQVAAQFQPDVALLDIGLPVMDGDELAQRMRELPVRAGGRLALVAVTGYGQDSDRARTRDAGFDDHLVKPVDLDALELVLDHLGAG